MRSFDGLEDNEEGCEVSNSSVLDVFVPPIPKPLPRKPLLAGVGIIGESVADIVLLSSLTPLKNSKTSPILGLSIGFKEC